MSGSRFPTTSGRTSTSRLIGLSGGLSGRGRRRGGPGVALVGPTSVVRSGTTRVSGPRGASYPWRMEHGAGAGTPPFDDADVSAAPPVSRRTLLVGGLAAASLVGAGASTMWLADRPSDEAGSPPGGGTAEGTSVGQPVTEYPVEGRGAPVELSGSTLTDEELDLEDLRGDVVVVNVWGSWCGPCRVEAPVLAQVSQDYRERGVSFVGVNVKDNRAAAVAFEEEHGITYPSIEDTDGRAVLTLSQYVPASAVPVTLVLDRDGQVAARVLGAVREATLTALLDTTLAETP